MTIAELRAELARAVSERDRLWTLYCAASQAEVQARIALTRAECEAVKDEDDNG